MKKLIPALLLLIPLSIANADDIGIPCDVNASTTPLSIGDIFECSIEAVGDSDVYTFSGSAGDSAIVTLSDTGNISSSLLAEVYHSGILLTTLSAANTGTQHEFTLLDSDTYTVLVFENGNNNTDTYNLALQRRAPLPTETQEICVDCVIQGGTISPIADSDILHFTQSAGTTVALTLADTGNISSSLLADVYDPSQLPLTTLNAANTGVSQTLLLNNPGTYTIHLYENGDNNTDTYNVALQQLFPTPATASPLLYEVTVEETVEVVTDSDVYTFTGVSGDSVILTLSDTGNISSSMQADIYDPNQVLLTTLSAANTGVSETLALDISGSYTVHVYEIGNNNTDTYALNLQCLFGSCFGNPDISVSPSRFNFGDVEVGTASAPQTFTVTNLGDADLSGLSLSLNQNSFTISNDTCSSATVAPQLTCTFDVVFTPQTAARVIGRLSIQSNDPDTPSLDITLVGTGTASGEPGVIGGSVFGMGVNNVTCANRTTGLSVSISTGSSDWDCGEAGLTVNPGDSVQISIQGSAD